MGISSERTPLTKESNFWKFFEELALERGLTPRWITDQLWSVEGGKYRVDFIPRNRNVYQNGKFLFKSPSIHNVFRLAFSTKVFSSKKVPRYRKNFLAVNPHCYLCNIKLTEKTATIDHIIPKSRGGKLRLGNVALCCKLCNTTKSGKSLIDALQLIKK